ncbi:MAG: hypothetical protein LUC94_04680 [Clostridiales bacterium]|nr:hypothetical protein [Clostridiales bacterium]
MSGCLGGLPVSEGMFGCGRAGVPGRNGRTFPGVPKPFDPPKAVPFVFLHGGSGICGLRIPETVWVLLQSMK